MAGGGSAEPLQLDVNDRQPVTVRQLFEQLADIAFGIGGFFVRGRENLQRVVQRIVQCFTPRSCAEKIHQLITCDSMHPGSQRLVRAIGVAAVVHGQQDFLHDILDVILQVINALPQEAAQMSRQVVEERPIGDSVAIQAANE